MQRAVGVVSPRTWQPLPAVPGAYCWSTQGGNGVSVGATWSSDAAAPPPEVTPVSRRPAMSPAPSTAATATARCTFPTTDLRPTAGIGHHCSDPVQAAQDRPG